MQRNFSYRIKHPVITNRCATPSGALSITLNVQHSALIVWITLADEDSVDNRFPAFIRMCRRGLPYKKHVRLELSLRIVKSRAETIFAETTGSHGRRSGTQSKKIIRWLHWNQVRPYIYIYIYMHANENKRCNLLFSDSNCSEDIKYSSGTYFLFNAFMWWLYHIYVLVTIQLTERGVSCQRSGPDTQHIALTTLVSRFLLF